VSLVTDETDEELMRRAQSDEVGAFDRLYMRHASRALAVARTVCQNSARAEDAVQEGFLSIWRSRASFRPENGSFQGWSMRIVRHRAIDAVRRDSAGHRAVLRPERNGEEQVASGSIQDDAIARDEGDALRISLQGLPEAQAEVIVLAFYGELTHSEIAVQLSLPEGTVKGRMRLGLEKLRRQTEARG
jgi:RNA polymerase sigma-70 factor (ECF subfamily)